MFEKLSLIFVFQVYFFFPIFAIENCNIDSLMNIVWKTYGVDDEYAIKIAEKVYVCSSNFQDKSKESDILIFFGSLNMRIGNLIEADSFFQLALLIREDLKDSIGIVSVLNNLGKLKQVNGALTESFYYLFKGLKLSDQIHSDSLRPYLLLNLANSLEADGNFTEAIKYNIQSLIIFKRLMNLHSRQEDSLSVADAYYDLGIKFYRDNNPDSAELYLSKASALYALLQSWKKESWTLNLLAAIELQKNNLPAAETYFQKGIALYEMHQDTSIDLYDFYMNYGYLKMEMEQPVEALSLLRRGQAILGKKGGLEDHWYMSSNLAEAFSMLEQYDSAYFYQTEATILQDSFYNIEKAKALTNAQVAFDTERKEKELAEEKLLNQQKTTERNTLLLLLLGTLSIGFGVFYFLRQRQKAVSRIAAQESQIQQQKIEDLLKTQELNSINSMLEGQEKERQRIAKDLHDRVGSILTAVKWNFESLVEGQNNQISSAQISKTGNLLDEAYQEVRQVAHNMVSGVLTKFGLLPALNELARIVSDKNRLKVEIVTYGLSDRLDTPLEITVYRIIQELLSNALKHAEASNITIQLQIIQQNLQINVEDDGIGFDLEASSDGMGFKNISARLEQLNGTIQIDTGKGAGTSIMIEIPNIQ